MKTSSARRPLQAPSTPRSPRDHALTRLLALTLSVLATAACSGAGAGEDPAGTTLEDSVNGPVGPADPPAQCASVPAPSAPSTPVVFVEGSDGGAGPTTVFMVLSRSGSVPPGCDTQYEVSLDGLDSNPSGPVSFHFVMSESEGLLTDRSGFENPDGGFIRFNDFPSSTDDRARFAEYAIQHQDPDVIAALHLVVTTRITLGSGIASPWSPAAQVTTWANDL